jgi:hypothetical protein
MGPRRSAFFLSALAGTTTTLLLVTGCRKPAPAPPPADAGSEASTADAASATTEEDAAATPVAAAAPAPTTVELAAAQPAPLPFPGTYRCFGGMKLEQAGRIVTSTMHKGTTDTVLACTAAADNTCTGTVREIVTVRGRPPKVNHVKPVTLTLAKNGDVVYVVASADKKGGRGEQTFCPRR